MQDLLRPPVDDVDADIHAAMTPNERVSEMSKRLKGKLMHLHVIEQQEADASVAAGALKRELAEAMSEGRYDVAATIPSIRPYSTSARDLNSLLIM